MSDQTLTIAGTKLRVEAASGVEGHIETVYHHNSFLRRDMGYRIWENARQNGDRYSYEDAQLQRYSHPTLTGARLMIAQSLVKCGAITVPLENTHLDHPNLIRLKEISEKRIETFQGVPRTGDIVYIENVAHRISACHKFGAQTSAGGSIHICRSGSASFSGGLDRSRMYECFTPHMKPEPARFWMWDAIKGMGGGNGVEIYVNTQVWSIDHHNLTDEQLRTHPNILRFRKVFNDCSYLEKDVAAKIERMKLGFTG